jgi:murein DD-endopeptidase MepM/ murein hydrolase activator NlpD
MSIQEHGRKRCARVGQGCAALLMCVFMVNAWAIPAFSQAGESVSCFSVISLEQGQTIEGLARKYHTTVAQILEDNPSVKLMQGDTLTIRENTVTDNAGLSRGSNVSWHWPASGSISSDYGWRGYKEFHHGIDIAIPSGTDVKVARPGKVVKAGWLGVYGLALLVDHGNGVQTLYGHNQKLLTKVGERVEAGDRIAISGNTGRSTGPHLHFEIRFNGKTVDPNRYLPLIASAQK